ncbi:MAG: family 16 glycoside hydrolase [Pirellulaceae bacterium]
MVRAAFLFVVVLIPALSIEGKEVEGQRPTKVWNRTGSLGEAPERVADDYPLSDQQNNDETNWISLFNGKNLDGWRVKCRPGDEDKTGYWKVVDGTITADTPPNSKHHLFGC